MSVAVGDGAVVSSVAAAAYTVPTDEPEADGTISWEATTIVVVQVHAGDLVGTGWTYGSPVIAPLVEKSLAPVVVGSDVLGNVATWSAMVRALRNIGRRGLAGMGLSAVDCALWDLKARVLGLPLHRLLGSGRDSVPLYGSGGFTTYTADRLAQQLTAWVEDDGMRRVKIKIGESWGSRPDRDLERARQAREVVGPDVELFVDANGGYDVGQAVRVGRDLDELGVRWFEEPVSSDDLTGLGVVRRAVLADVAAGEYGDSLDYFHTLCRANVLDCVQVDVTRCGGITELLRVAAVAAGAQLDVSGHCAPHEHAAVLAAVPNLRHLEYFHDHVRIERLFFDGIPAPVDGQLPLPTERPGNGLSFRTDRAERYRAR
ncbi:MAG TPA: enolase C-terminal domain-like protein [Ornithinibacter sp.]|nr:enolase C-terminal domain-like protein [Ornithinibacter sp.]